MTEQGEIQVDTLVGADVEKLVYLYEKVLHGADNKIGLFDCYDTYYVGCWDEDLKQIKVLLNDLKIKP